jgi:predicted PurR-regulated permease PerM
MARFIIILLIILAIIFLLAMIVPVTSVQPLPEDIEFPTEGFKYFWDTWIATSTPVPTP